MDRIVIRHNDITNAPLTDIISQHVSTVAHILIGNNQALSTYQRRVECTLSARCSAHIQHACTLANAVCSGYVVHKLRSRLLNIVGTGGKGCIERKLRSLIKIAPLNAPRNCSPYARSLPLMRVIAHRGRRCPIKSFEQTLGLNLSKLGTHIGTKEFRQWTHS